MTPLPTSGDNLLAADIRDVVARLDRAGQLRHVAGADWALEAGAITELMALRDGPALLFDKLRDYAQGRRLLVNVLNSPARVALLLGLPPDIAELDLVRAIRGTFAVTSHVPPTVVDSATFREVSHERDDVDLFEFPSPLWHEQDGGRYLGTACVVVTQDRDASWTNLGTYRVQVHDDKTLGVVIRKGHHGHLMMQQYWERGEDAPVAVCIGVQPNVLISSFVGVPWKVSEYDWAGGLTQRPVEVVRGQLTGMLLPARAEIVVEGHCPPPDKESRLEGPFGETFGYYASGAQEESVINVGLVQHRRDPILVGSPPLRPPASSNAAHLFYAANLWTEIERIGLPDVRGVWMMPAGSSSLLAVVSIKQRYSGHAKQVGLAAMTGRTGGGQLGRFVIVVDDDIDPSDTDQVLWALATRCDPAEDIDVIRNHVSSGLDPRLHPAKRAAGEYSTSRAVVVACRPYHWREESPPTVGTSPELRERILRSWPELFTQPAQSAGGSSSRL